MTLGFGAEHAPAPTPAAGSVFGDRMLLAQAYAERLASDGVIRGLIGPREVERLWDRHLVNSALLCDLIPSDAHVVDIGSGAGLPGIPMAILRRDLTVTLVEPMLRRVTFLLESIAALSLGARVDVVRGRAEERSVRDGVGEAAWVVARAVAPLDRLVNWCLPLVAPGGQLLALKGATVHAEVDEHRRALERAGVSSIEIRALGVDVAAEPTWAVCVQRAGRPVRRAPMGRKR